MSTENSLHLIKTKYFNLIYGRFVLGKTWSNVKSSSSLVVPFFEEGEIII